ncbi:MAG: 4a-hydroxytetrahydrobiopterin dehydratase [Pseudomonadales bacterium]|jgi:4a-hydroxytetrahydrobiopterin dehydratase|nr:4a-hydroxytetrahydrobiopterin dehydratase [Pseudomonadales bacterium]MDP7576982.1 4a-hydroxytetrahydrobiopterin dehydratase [Pseudomonadales bacterium]|tara:strand:- start:1588 stop:1866 length:279 start_codon:yes stop_codon:yes gene_type:complete
MEMWQEDENALTADLVFEDFESAFKFMTIVAGLAEAHNHHPDWRNVYNQVSIRLTTHDAGNTITDKDRDLAMAIESHPDVQGLIVQVRTFKI